MTRAVEQLGCRTSNLPKKKYTAVYMRTSGSTYNQRVFVDRRVFVEKVPLYQLSMSMARAEMDNLTITHILLDENKSRTNKIKLHEGQAKLQQLVQTGTVHAVVVSDVIRISGNENVSAMHREIFRVTGTQLLVGDIGVDPEDHLRLEHDHKRKRGEFVEHARTERKDLVEGLDKRTQEEHEHMYAIGMYRIQTNGCSVSNSN